MLNAEPAQPPKNKEPSRSVDKKMKQEETNRIEEKIDTLTTTVNQMAVSQAAIATDVSWLKTHRTENIQIVWTKNVIIATVVSGLLSGGVVALILHFSQ